MIQANLFLSNPFNLFRIRGIEIFFFKKWKLSIYEKNVFKMCIISQTWYLYIILFTICEKKSSSGLERQHFL